MKNEMGEICSMNGGGEKLIKELQLKNLKRIDHLGDFGIEKGIILKWILMKWNVSI
jgi:hypothetical protein